MKRGELKQLLVEEKILNKIFMVRGTKVTLDFDLAEMYGVETKRLNEQVKRNLKRFPKDFMFTLTKREWENLRSQIATSSWGGRRNFPLAFTEQGVAMLSSVLNSDVAIEVNIRIIRVFTKLKEYALTQQEIVAQLAVSKHGHDIGNIFALLKELLDKQQQPTQRNPIGFRK